MNIELYTESKKVLWDEYVQRSKEATFFHLTGWKRAMERAFGYRSFYLLAEAQGQIKGILPLFLTRNLSLHKALISIPHAAYGGICADDRDTENLLLEEAKKLAKQERVDYLELRNIQLKHSDLPTKDLYVTFQQELDPDPEKNMENIYRKTRTMIRQGIKNNLKSEIGRDYLKEFYHIFASSYHNLGSPVYPLRLFKILLEEFPETCKILVVKHEGKILSGVMTFFFKDQVLPYYGGALKEAYDLKVNNFMYWELMKYGSEQGYKIFDFGRSKKGSGSFDFKKHWGMTPQQLHYQYYLNRSPQIPDINPLNPKYQKKIGLWKKLPLSLTKAIGPWIVKYIP
jgi:FemAB-related protein (PEP-CTERM system-associated)